MNYSIHFYAMNAESVAKQFRTEPEALLQRVEQRIRDETRSTDGQIQITLAKAAEICRGEIPDDCDVDSFHALCWLAEVTAEKVTIGSFVEFHWWQMDEDGIWPLLLRSRPPFPVTVCSDPPPQVGFLSVDDIEQFALPALDGLPTTDAAEVSYARQEFREVLESLVEDKLDLLAVLL